uniref:Pentatricopeptide repeat-containing protein n=1 Tax=Aegilops tauschii TaxID=37682 RepID=R7WBK3_AEGTA|nr:protein Rf1, mitochondrial-like [Aegilops tauschii subsp. strangulata]
MGLVSEMINRGIPPPDIVFFNSVINSLCKEGRVTDAQDIFDLVIYFGERPDIFTFNSLIDGYCLVGEMEKAFGVLDTMASGGIEPDSISYNTIVNGYFKNDRIDDGLALFREMLKKVKPTTVTYNIILDGLFGAGKTVAAKKTFHEMIESGITVSISTYRIILGGLCRNSCDDEAITLFQKLGAMNVKLDITILNTMINALFKVQRREEANNLFATVSASVDCF